MRCYKRHLLEAIKEAFKRYNSKAISKLSIQPKDIELLDTFNKKIGNNSELTEDEYAEFLLILVNRSSSASISAHAVFDFLDKEFKMSEYKKNVLRKYYHETSNPWNVFEFVFLAEQDDQSLEIITDRNNSLFSLKRVQVITRIAAALKGYHDKPHVLKKHNDLALLEIYLEQLKGSKEEKLSKHEVVTLLKLMFNRTTMFSAEVVFSTLEEDFALTNAKKEVLKSYHDDFKDGFNEDDFLHLYRLDAYQAKLWLQEFRVKSEIIFDLTDKKALISIVKNVLDTYEKEKKPLLTDPEAIKQLTEFYNQMLVKDGMITSDTISKLLKILVDRTTIIRAGQLFDDFEKTIGLNATKKQLLKKYFEINQKADDPEIVKSIWQMTAPLQQKMLLNILNSLNKKDKQFASSINLLFKHIDSIELIWDISQDVARKIQFLESYSHKDIKAFEILINKDTLLFDILTWIDTHGLNSTERQNLRDYFSSNYLVAPGLKKNGRYLDVLPNPYGITYIGVPEEKYSFIVDKINNVVFMPEDTVEQHFKALLGKPSLKFFKPDYRSERQWLDELPLGFKVMTDKTIDEPWRPQYSFITAIPKLTRDQLELIEPFIEYEENEYDLTRISHFCRFTPKDTVSSFLDKAMKQIQVDKDRRNEAKDWVVKVDNIVKKSSTYYFESDCRALRRNMLDFVLSRMGSLGHNRDDLDQFSRTLMNHFHKLVMRDDFKGFEYFSIIFPIARIVERDEPALYLHEFLVANLVGDVPFKMLLIKPYYEKEYTKVKLKFIQHGLIEPRYNLLILSNYLELQYSSVICEPLFQALSTFGPNLQSVLQDTAAQKLLIDTLRIAVKKDSQTVSYVIEKLYLLGNKNIELGHIFNQALIYLLMEIRENIKPYSYEATDGDVELKNEIEKIYSRATITGSLPLFFRVPGDVHVRHVAIEEGVSPERLGLN